MKPVSRPYAAERLPAILTRPVVLSVSAAAVIFTVIAVTLIMLRPILPLDETRYFSIAWEMWNGSSAIVPHLNGEPYSDKPPLLFWLINGAWAVFGTDSPAARLVAPSFGVACLFLTARFARRLWPEEPTGGAVVAWILATSGVFLLFGSLTMFDTMLATATLLANIGVLRARREPGRRIWLVVGTAIGFGLLAKGPVILLHVLPVALLMPIWATNQQRPPRREWYRGVGLALATGIAIVLVWLVPALMSGGREYGYDILWRQHGGRLVESFAHEQPSWFYLALLPLFTWPWAWSGPVLTAPWRTWLKHDEGLRFCFTWILGSLLLFSLVSGKQVHYLLPEMCALALIIGHVLFARKGIAGSAGRSRPFVALVLPVGLFLSIVAANSEWLAPALAGRGLNVPWTAALLAGAILALLISVVLWERTGITGWLLVAPATMLMVHILASPVLYAVYDAGLIGRKLASHEQTGIALFLDDYRGEFSYAGRLTGPVVELADEQAVYRWSCLHPGGVILSRHALAVSGYRPLDAFSFRGRTYRLLEVPDAGCPPSGLDTVPPADPT